MKEQRPLSLRWTLRPSQTPIVHHSPLDLSSHPRPRVFQNVRVDSSDPKHDTQDPRYLPDTPPLRPSRDLLSTGIPSVSHRLPYDPRGPPATPTGTPTQSPRTSLPRCNSIQGLECTTPDLPTVSNHTDLCGVKSSLYFLPPHTPHPSQSSSLPLSNPS